MFDGAVVSKPNSHFSKTNIFIYKSFSTKSASINYMIIILYEIYFKSPCRMQRNIISNNNGVHQACAACKHQRKKCSENCILAPYFPSSRRREFKAVHKVFGVSNITKFVRNAQEGDRRKVVDSLIWEALSRQKDPINGSYGEYTKVYNEYKRLFDELKMFRDHQNQLVQVQPQGKVRAETPDHNAVDYHHLHHGNHKNGIVDSTTIYNTYCSNYLQDLDSLRTEVVIPNIQQHSQSYYIAGTTNLMIFVKIN